MPIRPTVSIAANIARSSIGLRPRRSETAPQTGAAITITPAPPALIRPDQMAAESVVSAPSSLR